MIKPGSRLRMVLIGLVVLLVVGGVSWALVSGIDILAPDKVGGNTADQIVVTVKNGDTVVPNAKILVTTNYGWIQRGEEFPEKAKIGELKQLEDEVVSGDKAKRAVYTSNEDGKVFFIFYGDPADVGKEATVIVRELDGTFQTSFRIRIGENQLVQGDPLPVCSPVLFDKQADAGGDPANHPIFMFWVGFQDAAGNLVNVDDAEATVYCTLLTPDATLITQSKIMFGKYVPIALENVPAGGASVYIELVGDSSVAAAGTINTWDTPDPRGSNASLWRD